jgi:prepilin-type N-terminal cleavage/methylation domain-containing protein
MGDRTRRTGFTLIELLVTIAIIAILAGIMFPIFAAARERAKSVTCTSNARQMHMAWRMYCEDWEAFPALGSDKAAQRYRMPAYLGHYTKSNEVFRCPCDTWALAERKTQAFVQKKTYFYNGHQLAILDRGLFAEVGTSYVWSLSLCGLSPSDPVPLGSDLLEDPAGIVWSYDSFRSHLWSFGNWRRGVSERTIVFADGHCGSFDRERSREAFSANGMDPSPIW